MTVEKCTIRSQGVDLATTINKPTGEGNHPVALLLPGFFYRRSARHMESLAAALTNAGIIAVRFDYPGFGESNGTVADDYRFSNFLTAVEDVRRTVAPDDGSKISLCGHSMGGIIAVTHAANHPESVQNVSVISSSVGVGTSVLFTGIRDEWKRRGFYEFPTGKGEPLQQVPYAFLEDAAPFDTLSAAERLSTPLLVVVGSGDTVVNPTDTIAIFDKAGSSTKQLKVIEGMEHNYARQPEYMTTVNQLIGICCGAGPHHVRSMAEALGRVVPSSRYSPDMSQHGLLGDKKVVKKHEKEYLKLWS